MRKIIIIIYTIFLSLILSLEVKAYTTTISNTSIRGTDTATVGQTFSEGFHVEFSNLKKGSTDTLGIYLVIYELEYDESTFIIEEIIDNGKIWNSTIYKEDGKVYVISEFYNDPLKNACVDGILYCADYTVSINFYVKDTNATNSTIKMKQVGVGTFPVSGDINATYLIDDMIELEYPNEATQTINIKKVTNTTTEKEPESIISTTVPKVENPPTSVTTTNTNKEKSNNKYLKSLSIEDYDIDFTKETKSYDINIKEDVNKLNITATPEDTKASVQIIGSDNLKANDYKVLIKVTAENGEEETYYINAQKDEEKLTKKEEVKEPSQNKETLKLSKKTIILISIGITLLVISIIIFTIINHISNNKINKKLDL